MYAIESKSLKLMLCGDHMEIASAQFIALPVTIAYDSDAHEAAVQRKKSYLDAGRGHYLVAGTHLPFPGIGHVRAKQAGYAWVPVDYDTVR